MPSTRTKRVLPKLVIAIDIGTTYSAASYCISVPNKKDNLKDRDLKPRTFQEVNRWPKQMSADAKIPSVIYYDSDGMARIHGAETEDENSLYEAEMSGWQKAEWWKLCLRPDYLPLRHDFQPTFLPPGITVDDTFRDQLLYMRDNIRAYIVKAHTNGAEYWKELAASMEVVLTTPNGWEGKDQERMRQAAINAGLVHPDEGARVKFVSEGEAAIHYCLGCSDIVNQVQTGSTVIICDAGGGTIDIGVYKINGFSPIKLEEVLSPQCLIAGGAFVTKAASDFIKGRLRGSIWDTPTYLANAYKSFDKSVKRQFTGKESKVYLTLDGSRINDEVHGVSRGRLGIPGNEMASFFEPSLRTLKQGLEETIRNGFLSPDKIFVVGGFAESEYAFSELQSWAVSNNLEIAKPDQILSKAIPHGALSWYHHSAVQARVARMHYGAETDKAFGSHSPDMLGRSKFQNILGEWRVRDAWSSIVKKDARLRNGEERTAWFHRQFSEHDKLAVEMELFAYRWGNPPPFFRHKDGHLVEGFIQLGTVQGDLQDYFKAETWKKSPSGIRYKNLNYEVCLCFDEIEIKAFLRWRENGRVKIGKATIVYDL